ncbi:MAG: hypothetical protein ABFC89_07930 [Methanospirillum sp.]
MKGRPVCEICGKKAIGIQSLGCCAATVCAEHAESALRDAKPGEMIVAEFSVFKRFEDSPDARDEQ